MGKLREVLERIRGKPGGTKVEKKPETPDPKAQARQKFSEAKLKLQPYVIEVRQVTTVHPSLQEKKKAFTEAEQKVIGLEAAEEYDKGVEALKELTSATTAFLEANQHREEAKAKFTVAHNKLTGGVLKQAKEVVPVPTFLKDKHDALDQAEQKLPGDNASAEEYEAGTHAVGELSHAALGYLKDAKDYVGFLVHKGKTQKSVENLEKQHAQAAHVKDLTDDAKLKLTAAQDLANQNQLPQAGNALGQIDTLLTQAKGHADKYQQYLDKKAVTDGNITTAEGHTEKAKLTTEIQAAKDKVTEAERLAAPAERKYDDAMKALGEADATAAAATTKGDMLIQVGSGTPNKTVLKQLVAKPGGTKLLDEVVKGLGAKPNSAVIQAALEARFDITVENFDKTGSQSTTKGARSLKRMYDLMALVPDSHTRDNDKLKLIQRFGGKSGLPTNKDRGSWYRNNDEEGLVVLSCGRPKDLGKKTRFGLPEAEDDCKPKDDVKPDYFDFTTLHEVGHAVDENKGFMGDGGPGKALAGWEVHTPEDFAAIIGKHFRFEKPGGETITYLVKYMKGQPATPPDPPNGVTPEQWDQRRTELEAWWAKAKSDASPQQPWYGEADAIGNKYYHQSYPWQWVSYNTNARTKGISPYQFRAPGEWFADLYAAYHCGKLQDGNPAVAWLKDL
jgi:hypothetical protein